MRSSGCTIYIASSMHSTPPLAERTQADSFAGAHARVVIPPDLQPVDTTLSCIIQKLKPPLSVSSTVTIHNSHQCVDILRSVIIGTI
mmetsp:Transcript_36082/g.59376  ORF Transcript_36082/g.59376 Transcript_36082/m.59376 type:complete len:87 (-) Transcript_36082:649-909(-)